jgi:hypothetical protein
MINARDISALLAAETRAREGDADGLADTVPTPGIDQLAVHARRLGLIERLLVVASEAIDRSGADQGSRFLLAEVAIDLVSARELVYRADPADDLQVGLSGVATRDALTDALGRVAQLALPEQWEEFVAIRAAAETELRRDPTGGADLQTVAMAVIGETRDLMGLTGGAPS